MSQTHRAKVVLQSGEAVVVADVEFWNYIIEYFESQIEQPEDSWQDAANFIREQVEDTVYYEPTEEWA